MPLRSVGKPDRGTFGHLYVCHLGWNLHAVSVTAEAGQGISLAKGDQILWDVQYGLGLLDLSNGEPNAIEHHNARSS